MAQPRKKKLTGPALKDILSSLGLPVLHCTRKRATGHFEIEFAHKDWSKPVMSANAYSKLLTRYLGSLHVHRSYEKVADWRTEPYLMCTVLTIELPAMLPEIKLVIPPSHALLVLDAA